MLSYAYGKKIVLPSTRSTKIMAYSVKSKKSGKTYFLHSQEVELAGGRKQRIYYFAGEEKKKYVIDALPAGYEVTENSRTGLPMLRKKKK